LDLARGSRGSWLSIWLLAVPAHAQDLLGPEKEVEPAPASAPEAPQKPNPPRFLGGPEVPYPEGQSRDAEVVLELLIDTEGRVESARAVSGEEPFTVLAEQAALAFSFDPARVKGEARRSVIRFKIAFRAPVEGAQAVPIAGLRLAPPSEGVASTASEPLEVAVIGTRTPGSTRLMTDDDARILPGAEGDPVRAVQVLPGAVPTLMSGPFIGIRGAPPGLVTNWFDGIEIPYLFHLARGTAVVHPWLVESAALYGAGAPARLGNAVGGHIEAIAAPPEGRLRLNGRLRLTESALGLEVPFAGGRGSMMVAGRYSYTAGLVSLVAPEFALDYWDYQARVGYALTPSDRLEVVSFGSGDVTGRRLPDDSVREIFNGQFHRVALRYYHQAARGAKQRVSLSYGYDRWDANQSQFKPRAHSLTLQFEDSRPLSSKSSLSFGTSTSVRFQEDQYYANPDPSSITALDRTDEYAAVWLDWAFSPSPKTTFLVGVRADLYASGRSAISDKALEAGVGPRFLLSHQASRWARLHTSFGYAVAPPSTGQRPPGRTFPVTGGLTQSFLSDAGVEFSLPGDIKLDTSVFHNIFFDTGDVGTLRNLSGQLRQVYEAPELSRGQGQAYGFELSLRRTLFGPIQGFLSYTLSRSERTIGSVRGFAEFDRTHIFDVALGYNPGRNWLISLRCTAYTGYPARVDSAELAANPPRTTPYYQVDAQVSKRWLLNQDGAYWGFTAGILNATLQEETNDKFCSSTMCLETQVGPATIPTIGVEGEL
jgi:hypothetical protein